MQQRVPSQPCKGVEIPLRTGVGGSDHEHRATGQAIELHLGLEQGQGAIQATGVQLGVARRGAPYSVRHRFSPGRHIQLHRNFEQNGQENSYKLARIPHSGQQAIEPATVTTFCLRVSCMNFLRPTLLTLACLLAPPTFADDLPSLGDASSSIVSPQQEHDLGRAWLGLLRAQVPQLSDPQLKDFVETTVYRLAE